MKTILKITIFFQLTLSINSYAEDEKYAYESQPYKDCLNVVSVIKPGEIIKVEMKIETEMPVYEFDIRDEENQDWDVECNADTSKVIEIEREVFSPRHREFSEHMKINLEEAKTVALAKYPGEIIEIEYEIEENGLAVYEFDINTEDGKDMKVEINAKTGAIHEETREIWQIGYE